MRPSQGRSWRPPVAWATAPEMVYLRDTFWIAYSMNGQGTGLLRSTTGKAEGPYAGMGQITLYGGSPSMFEDDGVVRWLWDGGWIARMADDLTGLAESPRLLQPKATSAMGNWPLQVGRWGAFLFKADGRYYLCAGDINTRVGTSCHDTFVAWSDRVYGPYSERHLMVPHGGQVTVFQDEGGQHYATFCGQDDRAALRDRPGIVPLEWAESDMYFGDTSAPYPRRPRHVITERGPWPDLAPLPVPPLRDVQTLNAPDDFYYLTGSCKARAGKLVIWRSRDMAQWEEMAPVWRMDAIYSDPKWPDPPVVPETGSTVFWGPEIHYIKDSFYAVFRFSPHHGKQGGVGLLRSTTGKAAGPYESLGVVAGRGPASFFQDDDGRVYLVWASGAIAPMKPDMSGVVEEYAGKWVKWPSLSKRPDGTVPVDDTGCCLVKMLGRYVFFFNRWGGTRNMLGEAPAGGRYYGTYDYEACYSDKLLGPYTRPRIAIPHGGHGNVFQDRKGRWWATMFSNDSTAPWEQGRVVLVLLRVELREGELLIDVADGVPPAD